MRLLIMGPPGAGKGTQAGLVAEHYGIPAISTGDIFRAMKTADTPLAHQVRAIMDSGAYVSDEITNAIVLERLVEPDCANGFLLDGYPRTLEQVRTLDAALDTKGTRLNAVISLQADVEEVVVRLLKRAEIEGRSDDNEDTIRIRLREYAEKTAPLLDVYRQEGILVEVDGLGPIDEVSNRLFAALDKIAPRTDRLKRPVMYPDSRRSDVVETPHGQPIADPYRWLEDPDAAETVAWVAEQNEVTEAYLAGLPDREWFAATMRSVVRRPRAGVPSVRGGRYVVTRNDGTQNQDVWFVADSLDELRTGGRVLVDPNTLSEDGTRSLTSFAVSTDGARAAYGLSDAGSDWATFSLIDLASGAAIDDAPVTTKFSSAAWLPDGRSYVYTSFPAPAGADGTETVALTRPSLRLHRVGETQEADEDVLDFPDDDALMMFAAATDDDRFLEVSIVAGTDPRNRLWLYPLETGSDGRSRLGAVVKVVDEPVAEFAVVVSDGSRLVVQTDLDAERGRLLAVDLEQLAVDGSPDWVEVVPEREATLLTVTAVRDGFVAAYLADAALEVRRFDRSGRDRGIVPVGGGSLVALNGQPDSAECFAGLSSVTSPTQALRIDPATGEVTALPDLVPVGEGGFVPPGVTVERRAATSADGTRVPYFLVIPDGVDRSAPQPTLLWGYGGFKIPVLADYRSGWSGWLAAGGQLALANLRGGGEFGSGWHDAGRLDRKQNVFDDFVAVAEHLTESGATTPSRLALHGRSNGGLLIGAVMTQRPDLAAVALPAVGVLDMLRFSRFTIGAAWISDYGDPDDPEQFAVLRAYSPLHSVVPGTAYPATLVLTGDHDDRVVPLHSHKFTATLQHAQAGEAPVLTRIETAAGHGMGRPAWLEAAEWADLLAFAAHHTGLHPRTAP